MKPVLRTIHHLSCTGGTLISKCLASMSDVALLSELHPFIIGPLRFNPFDPVQQLFSQKIIDADEEALKFVFRSRIEMAYHLSKINNKKLILRDHTHSDFLSVREPKGFKLMSMINTLKFDYEIKSILSVRNPVDTFLSLEKNGWAGGVKTFDEYCRRVRIMLEAYKGITIIRYEDFCCNPDAILQEMCDLLDFKFDPSYKENFFNVRLTGDSGRGKEIKEIKPLPRREYSDEYLRMVESSENFAAIRSELAY